MRSISLALLLLAAGVFADNDGGDGHGPDQDHGGGDHGGGAQGGGSDMGDQGDQGDMGGSGGGSDGDGAGGPGGQGDATPVPAVWDGQCYYARPDVAFDLTTYLGRWYQVAGTEFPYTAGAKCVSAFYTLNGDGSVGVNNTSEAPDGAFNAAVGTARPADPRYGAAGAFTVEFPDTPGSRGNPCPGPNYVVQDYTGDWAVVQSMNFSTLFLLAREQRPGDDKVDAWIRRAGQLGADLAKVSKTNQEGCKYLS